MNYSRTLIF